MNSYSDIYCVVDTETSGMRPPDARIIDLAIIRVEHGQEVGRLDTLLNAGVQVPDAISRLTGITTKDLFTAPSFDEVAVEAKELLEGAVFVAHNAAFDYRFITDEFRRIGIDFTAECLCSVRLSRALYPGVHGHSLENIIARFGIDAPVRHRAMADVEALRAFMDRAEADVGPTLLKQAVDRIRARSGKLQGSLSKLTDSAGVYFFYGEDEELLYIGKSKHVRSRALSHLRREDKRGKMIVGESARIESVETSGELSALLLEASLIKRQSPVYNRALRKQKQLAVARRTVDARGYACADVSYATSLDSSDESIISVFRSAAQGKAALRMLAKEARLCHKLLGIERGAGECFGRQIGACDGACVGAEAAHDYNARFDTTFERRKIRVWPYTGPIMIREEKDPTSGTVFFIDQWALLGAYTYDGSAYAPLLTATSEFDYDTYKILARFILARENRRRIQQLTQDELSQALSQARSEYEATIT